MTSFRCCHWQQLAGADPPGAWYLTYRRCCHWQQLVGADINAHPPCRAVVLARSLGALSVPRLGRRGGSLGRLPVERPHKHSLLEQPIKTVMLPFVFKAQTSCARAKVGRTPQHNRFYAQLLKQIIVGAIFIFPNPPKICADEVPPFEGEEKKMRSCRHGRHPCWASAALPSPKRVRQPPPF